MKRRDDMTFPPAEYERRLRELRERMEHRMLDVVIVTDPGNLMYLTDYQTTGYSYFQALVVPIDAEPFMLTRKLEESNVHARTWVEDTCPYDDTGDAIQRLVNALRDRGLADRAIGYERNGYFFPAYQQDRFQAAFAGHNLFDCYGLVEEGRICKSPAELGIMQRAARATEAGMRAGFEAVASGVTENEVAGAVCQAMFAAGGEYPAVLPYITSGPRTMIGHATWEGRTIQPGEPVFLEIGGCFRRYHTAMMRTCILGEPTAGMRNAEARMIEALERIHDMVRPGVTVSEVDRAVRDIVSNNTCGAVLVTRAGYSIGIAFPPSWDEGSLMSLKPGDHRVLEEGMTFHVIPWMWGVDGHYSMGISDTIRVTSDGCASFFDLDREFVIKERPTAVLSPQAVS